MTGLETSLLVKALKINIKERERYIKQILESCRCMENENKELKMKLDRMIRDEFPTLIF